jgi:putative ABC transport system substrate-binding protein
LLKEIAPRVTQVAVLAMRPSPRGRASWAQSSPSRRHSAWRLRPFGVRDAGEIERAVTAFARGSNGGLIALGGAGTTVHRPLNIRLAAELRLPAVYPYRYYVIDGGLISYGPNNIDLYRRAAGYSLPLQETIQSSRRLSEFLVRSCAFAEFFMHAEVLQQAKEVCHADWG